MSTPRSGVMLLFKLRSRAERKLIYCNAPTAYKRIFTAYFYHRDIDCFPRGREWGKARLFRRIRAGVSA